jgi:hypothetical protein
MPALASQYILVKTVPQRLLARQSRLGNASPELKDLKSIFLISCSEIPLSRRIA